MNRLQVKKLVGAIATAGLLFSNVVFPVAAAEPWDVTGSYDIAFECTPSCGGPYTHDAMLTQTGSSVSGDGGYPAGGPYTFHWDITSGSVAGSTINLTMDYDLGAPSTTMTMTGTIASDGRMSGTWTDNFGGSRSGTWSTTDGTAETKVSTPTIHTPANGATVTQSSFTEVDWTDASGTTPPFEYQYEAYADVAYTTLVYSSGWLANSEIPTPGTPPGDYYLRVRARDVEFTESPWSNGAADPYKVTVVADPNPFAVPSECSDISGLGSPIVGTNSSDTINGTSGNDLIFALDGSDKVDGKGGHDCIVGGDGSDRLIGGNGNDVILGGAASDSIEGNDGSDDLYGEEGSDSISGGDGPDDLFGGEGSDSLRGGNNVDNLFGGAGSDSLRGENGNDILDGEGGIDSANGGANTDSCTAESETACEV